MKVEFGAQVLVDEEFHERALVGAHRLEESVLDEAGRGQQLVLARLHEDDVSSDVDAVDREREVELCCDVGHRSEHGRQNRFVQVAVLALVKPEHSDLKQKI